MIRRIALLVPRVVVPGVVVLGVVLGALAATPAWAAPTTEIIQGRVLRLVSVADWSAASSLLPGERVQWDVEVSADAPDPGTVTVAVSATGGAPLVIDAALCMQPWQASGCPSGARTLESGWSIPRDGSEVALADFPASDVAHLRLWITLGGEEGGGGDDDDGAGITDVRVHARGVGEAVVTGPDGALPATGGTAAAGVVGAAVGLFLAGVGLLLHRRVDQDRGERA